jgi:hypothetical protein
MEVAFASCICCAGRCQALRRCSLTEESLSLVEHP